MLKLTLPALNYKESYLAALREFSAEHLEEFEYEDMRFHKGHGVYKKRFWITTR